eukprot:TRINITY_DN1387_c0_g1_i12.p1 TRINITY_DN1387_c0_g1~~TRINITY_DN1387_c0_g1_i12.p1  ORF type:complete len:190 (-),score=29.30 TRINITY_DN1387_c0_g1_i12:485-1054(-)
MDFGDEIGRTNMSSLLREMLPVAAKASDELSAAILSVLRNIYPNEDELNGVVSEVIADAREPLEETCGKVAEGEAEVQVWRCCCTITKLLLQAASKRTHEDPILGGLLKSVVLPAVTHVNPAVREGGVSCLGLFCLLHLKPAQDYLFLFVRVLQHDTSPLKMLALKALFDMAVAFGSTSLGIPDAVLRS